jgi:hypothetical protein
VLVYTVEKMSSIASAAMTIAMIAVFLLAFGGVRLLMKGGSRKQGALMLAAALVLLANVLIWTV